MEERELARKRGDVFARATDPLLAPIIWRQNNLLISERGLNGREKTPRYEYFRAGRVAD